MARSDFNSWGNFPKTLETVTELNWSCDSLPPINEFVLPRGLGRSYGDSCLNSPEVLISTKRFNHILSFNAETGVLRAESGVSLKDIIELTLPQGWFLPVTPGTKFVTLGGAIANDVHGKNHHIDGCFGNHTRKFEVLRSDGERLICNPEENTNLFNATIGGLGLTGLITWAEIQLKPVSSANIDVETIKFKNLNEFMELSEESKDYLYTVSWVDCLSSGSKLGRGLFMRGTHAKDGDLKKTSISTHSKLSLPLYLPSIALNSLSMRLLNFAYYNKQLSPKTQSRQNYNPFFYPLDSIQNWNRGYGKNGFLQYQFVVPHESGLKTITNVFQKIAESKSGSFLAVLKTFGNKPSPGLLSFPMEGITLALDFAIKGQSTFRLLNELDRLIIASGGRVYPAKDARMAKETFQNSYNNFNEFLKYKDPKFSSLFFRRIMGDQ